MATMRANTVQERSEAFLLGILERLIAKFSGTVRKGRVTDALGRFSYGAMLLGRFPLASAADETRAFVEGSASAGKVLVALIAELRKELSSDTEGRRAKRDEKGPDVRDRVSAVIKSVDPAYIRFGLPRVKDLQRRIRRSDFRGRADSSELTSYSVKFKGEDPSAAVALLMRLEGQGLVAIGRDPYRKRGAMIVLCGSGAIKEIRSSKELSSKQRRRLPSIRKRLTRAEMKTVGLGSAFGVRFPLSLKLVVLVGALFAVAFSAVIFATSYFIRQGIRTGLMESTRRSAEILGPRITADLRGIIARAQPLLSLRDTPGFAEDFFSENPEILYAGIEGKFDLFNASKVSDWDAALRVVARIRAEESALLDEGKQAPAVGAIGPYLGRPAVLIVVPYREAEIASPFIIAVDTSALQIELLSCGAGYSAVIGRGNSLVLRPYAADPDSGKTPALHPIVDALLAGGKDAYQVSYRDAGGEEYLGALFTTNFAGLSVVSVIPTRSSFTFADGILRWNLYLMGAALLLVVLSIYAYARNLTRTIGLLVDATRKVKGGDFSLDIEPAARDELGVLAASIAEMGAGLSDREKTRNAFGKFVEGGIADRGIADKGALRGKRRLVSVLFSSLHRSLSGDSEAEDSVALLNEYFSAVVPCVDRAGGFLDKLSGDSMIAVWGLPFTSERDSAAAVDAALLMRAAVESVNRTRASRGETQLIMGCAINAGTALGGRIGSPRRMEYTVFGPAVTQASRLERFTVPFGVDILVSESVRVELGAAYRLAVLPLVKVAGKARPQHAYAVLGRDNDFSAPHSVAELRERLNLQDRSADLKMGPEKPEKK